MRKLYEGNINNFDENGIVFSLRVWVKKEDYWTVNFDINEDSHDDGTLSWNIRYVGGLIKLGTPVDLQWGIEYNDIWRWDEETEEDYLDGYTTREVPGMMSWKTVRPDQERLQLLT